MILIKKANGKVNGKVKLSDNGVKIFNVIINKIFIKKELKKIIDKKTTVTRKIKRYIVEKYFGKIKKGRYLKTKNIYIKA